jgi:hypothetical protein
VAVLSKRTVFCLIDGAQIAVAAMMAGSFARDHAGTAAWMLVLMFWYLFVLYRDSRIEQ